MGRREWIGLAVGLLGWPLCGVVLWWAWGDKPKGDYLEGFNRGHQRGEVDGYRAGYADGVKADDAPGVFGAVGKRKNQEAFGHTVRAHIAVELQERGLARVGGPPRKLTRDQATAVVERLTDDQIIRGAEKCGALGDGSFLKFLKSVIRWPIDHPDQFIALLKELAPFLLLFMGDAGG